MKALRALLALLLLTLPVAGQMGGNRYASDSGQLVQTYVLKTASVTTTNITAAPAAGLSFYLYEAFCTNTSASTANVMLIKTAAATATASAIIPCPPAGAFTNPVLFDPPLKFPAATAVTMNSVVSITSAYLYAAGKIAR